jgi:hypothetical protein
MVARIPQSEGTDQAHAPTRLKIRIDSLQHVVDCLMRISLLLKRAKNVRAEPRVDLGQYRCSHFLLSAREKVVKAALSEAGSLFNDREARPFKAVLAKDLGKGGYDVCPLFDNSRHSQSPSSVSPA